MLEKFVNGRHAAYGDFNRYLCKSKIVSEMTCNGVTFHSRQESQPINIQLIGFGVCFNAQLEVINEAHDACDTCKEPDPKHK